MLLHFVDTLPERGGGVCGYCHGSMLVVKNNTGAALPLSSTWTLLYHICAHSSSMQLWGEMPSCWWMLYYVADAFMATVMSSKCTLFFVKWEFTSTHSKRERVWVLVGTVMDMIALVLKKNAGVASTFPLLGGLVLWTILPGLITCAHRSSMLFLGEMPSCWWML